MNEDLAQKVALLFVGWLLGLLGPVIVEAIRRRRENALGRQAMLGELNELGSVLATAAYGVRMSLGTAERSFLEWLKADLEAHATRADLQAFIPNLRTQLSWTAEDFEKAAKHVMQASGKGTVLQHYPVPLLDSRVSALWSFETSLQRDLLAIRQNLAILDDLVDRSRKYMDLTFTKLDEANFRLVNENHDQACALYAERAQIIVSRIRELERRPR